MAAFGVKLWAVPEFTLYSFYWTWTADATAFFLQGCAVWEL